MNLTSSSNRPTAESLFIPTITAEGAPRIVPASQAEPHNKAIEHQARGGALSGRQLRRIRRFAITGGVFVFLLSLGGGFLVRWLGWASQIFSYDEFALLLITVASRDAIFGAFLGIALSGLRRAAPGTLLDRSEWPGFFYSVRIHGSSPCDGPLRNLAHFVTTVSYRSRNSGRSRRFSSLRK